jgi:glucosamine--fructose-6-phosphate aminotransferase (isomerizing)
MDRGSHGRHTTARMTELERAIRSQPAELKQLVGRDLTSTAVRLRNSRRVWLVGSGSSQHVAELGALVFADAGLDARSSGSQDFARSSVGPTADDAVIVISHTGRTSFALAAREVAFSSGAEVLSITGVGAGWPEAIETVAREKSETYTASVTAALVVIFRIAHDLGAVGLARSDVESAVERVRSIVEQSPVPEFELPDRAVVLAGSGAGAVSAREGALKLREAAHVLAEGYGAEQLLHGHAVPLGRGDALLLIGRASDSDGLLTALGEAARGEGLAVASMDEPSIEHPILAQLPIIVRLQVLALSFSSTRSTNPDKAIAGHWADQAMWAIGRPSEAGPV